MDTFDLIQKALDTTLEEGFLYSESSLSELKTSELKNILKVLSLPIYGTKAILIERLLDNQEEVFEVESTITIERKEEEELNDKSTEQPGFVKPVTGIKV